MKKLACWLLLALASVTAQSAPLLDREVPAPLQAWIAWTLQGQDQRACPLRHATDVQRLCVWPSSLQLNLDDGGGRFELDARLYAPDWIALPGDAEHWPQELRVNGIPAPVALREGRPALWLSVGSQRIQGSFRWPQLPESLYVPAAAGLLELRVNAVPRAYPSRDDRGHVWLGRTAVAGVAEHRHLTLTVFRLIDDDIPARLTTHIDIEAAGEVRDEVIGPVLPPGFVALEISGSLPARLDDDGRLHVQVRPGIWNVEVTARATATLRELALPESAAPWPEQEVWSFLAHNDLRVVETGGAPALDPRQTQMPEGWRSYPAFLLQGDSARLRLDERQRGNPQPEADQLNLQRQLWLDFDGGGYSLQDQLNGRLNSRWRLEAAQPIAPGRVQVDGEPQLITRLADAPPGVEVRHGQLNLSADSRVDSGSRRLPVAGWNADFQSVETTLHLPPGWRLLAASGADNLPDTWIARWSLLDLFIVLIATVAALRLFGPGWGALTLLALLLSWQEPGAPRWAWLNLIAAIALSRALPDSLRGGQLPAWLQRYRWVSAAALLLIALPFAIQQARISIYPQLELQTGRGAAGAGSEGSYATADMVQEQAAEAPVAMSAPPPPPEFVERKRALRLESTLTSDSSTKVSQQAIQRIDPNVLTQTGPGVPEWTWRTATLSWSGPVTAEQSFRLWLLPPWLSRLLQVLSAALIFVVLARWMELQPTRPRTGIGKRAAVLAAISVAGLLAAIPQTLHAQQSVAEPQPPQQDLLDELRRRLLAAPDCAPQCVQIPRLALELGDSEQLTMRLSIDALAASALPLPLPLLASGAQGRIWQPAQVLLDGAPAPLLRGDDGTLSIAVASGRHEALIRGSLAGFDQLQLPLPLKPRWIDTQLRGWLLTGVDERGQIADALQLLRSGANGGQQPASGESAQQALPPLLIVTRTLHLGLTWDVDTQVRRVGVTHTPLLAEIALLAGEQITGEAVRVGSGAVLLSLAPGQDSAQWRSRLPVSADLKLSASPKTDRVEIWQFDVSPIWHAEFSGLPPISHQSGEYWLPRYQPWPGETLELRVVRPGSVQGQTLTLDAVELKTQPAQRATDVEANFRLRASQGGQHAIVLPEGLQLQHLSIDGQPQPARQEGGKLILPLRPGTQNLQLNLRSDAGIETLLQTPRLDLGLPGVNARLQVELPQDRWVLLVGGPRLGPAVLFWGVLAVLLLVAFALGRIKLTPVKFWHWALLMIGLSQLPVWGAAVVAAWLIALGLRGRYGFEAEARRFNAMQAALVALTVAALGLLFTAVAQGLLGAPDMQISGNESYGNTLLWFQDRWTTALPQAWVVSAPLWIYRLLMLAWALWLANALLAWLRWGWEQFTANGIWHRRPPKPAPADPPSSNTQPELQK